MKSTNSRKGQTSITHLMNFTLPPRPQFHQHSGYGRNTRRNPTWGLGSGYHAVDKSRFDIPPVARGSKAYLLYRYVHANYRFIVDPRRDYHPQAVDADVPLDWNDVLQILASAQSQSTSCPICLSTPAAPRMAKCGHIFCLPCLIRYMHSADEANLVPEKKARWKKCPICWDSVYISDTRPVRWFVGQEGETPQEGGDVVLRLMMRWPGSTLALPREGAELLPKSEEIPWYLAAEVMDYARIMKGSEDYMRSHFDDEIEEIQRQEKEDEVMFGEETQWTRKAVAAITDAKEKFKGIGNPPSTPKRPEQKRFKRPPIKFHEELDDVPDFYLIQHAAKSGQSVAESFGFSQSPSVAAPPLGSASATLMAQEADQKESQSLSNVEPSSNRLPHIPIPSSSLTSSSHARAKVMGSEHHQTGDSPFFFYQALLHYYLSPLDIRILKAAFGDFASFPTTILPRVERVSTGHIVDDDLRKRAKYLAHLPHGCEVGFLECNWTDVVVPEVLDTFKADIERRRKKNMDKEAREEKERMRAEKEEDDKRWAAARRKRPSISRDRADSDFLAISNPECLSPSAGMATVSSSPPWMSSQTRSGSAFAALASPSTSPVAPRTVWGTVIVPSSPPLQPAEHEHDIPENDGWLQGWEHDLEQEDDLISRVQASSIGEGSSMVAVMNGSGKRKKNKKITLMTTNARRGA